jgi:anti-sigma factor (TIGR02949 family)
MSDRATMMQCEEALRLLATYLDRELPASDAAEVERHLTSCRSCYSRAQFEGQLKSRLAQLGADRVPSDLEHRIRAMISRFAG